jgi:hypothetical protein
MLEPDVRREDGVERLLNRYPRPPFLVPAILSRANRVEPVGCFRLCKHLSQLQNTGKFRRQVIYVECIYR